MRESASPVALLPPGADDMRGKRVHIGRVLVPLDGSTLAARSVDYLLGLPRADALEYVLVEVVAPRGDAHARARATQRLNAVADQVRARGAKAAEVAVLEASEPSVAIVGNVREALDLIAMSTRGVGGLRRMVLGSVAEGVVRASEMPVMLLTPADLDTGGTH